jgi:flavin reductase (DIM6/NTAB) family NADH-FMN oxidoreductase RutF
VSRVPVAAWRPAAPPADDAYREACACLPAGVCVVTGADREGPCGLTASAVCSLSRRPPLVLVCIDKGSATLPRLLRSGRFAVNVLGAAQHPLAARFADRSPADRFAGVRYRLAHGCPVLDGSLAWLACDVSATYPGGDHTLVVGAVAAIHHGQGEPLVWHARRYRTLA